jgi:transposase-like protein
MIKSDVTCPGCGAGYRRLELMSQSGTKGEYRCPACDEVLEKFDGSALVAYRLTIQPSTRAIRDELRAAVGGLRTS